MGGRGASSGTSVRGKPYGSEYTTVYAVGNVKFVKYNDNRLATAPIETMTRGRVYVTINESGTPKFISYYDNKNKRSRQIDLDKPHHGVVPHTHHGYEHNERDSAKGFSRLTTEERKMVDRVKRIWYNRHGE